MAAATPPGQRRSADEPELPLPADLHASGASRPSSTDRPGTIGVGRRRAPPPSRRISGFLGTTPLGWVRRMRCLTPAGTWNALVPMLRCRMSPCKRFTQFGRFAAANRASSARRLLTLRATGTRGQGERDRLRGFPLTWQAMRRLCDCPQMREALEEPREHLPKAPAWLPLALPRGAVPARRD